MVKVDEGVAEFTFYRPDVSGVFLAGEFNDWRTDQLRMTRRSDGYWSIRLKLPAGVHKFRYLADGQWYNDYAAFGLEVGTYGLESVVLVEPAHLSMAQPAAAPAREVVAA